MKVVQTDCLTKYYGKSRGIDGVSLSIDEGDFFGFIGPNGAGKSTTIRILLGLISATEMCIRDRDVGLHRQPGCWLRSSHSLKECVIAHWSSDPAPKIQRG